MKAFSNTCFNAMQLESPKKNFFGTKSIVPAPVHASAPAVQAIVPFVFANPTFHHGSTFQNVGAQAQRPAVIRGSDLLHRVVGAIGHRKQTFTSAKHRYDSNRMKNVFHSCREMQVSEHRIKSYLMHSLSPMEKEVLYATSEYRNHHLTSPEQIILAHKSRAIKNRVRRQYNKLLESTFPGIKEVATQSTQIENCHSAHLMTYTK
jgi:hypothetical protein